MKKVLFLLMFPVLCFGQGDFRKMNWGQSVEDLKTAYPEEQFEKGIDIGCDIYIHSGDLIGIEAQIVYVFSDNKLIAGMYYLDPLNEFKRSILRLKDYKNISNRLKQKYTMKNENEWIVTTWKDDPNSLHHAVNMGHVTLMEIAEIGDTRIAHTLSKDDNHLSHLLAYASNKWIEIMQQQQSDDF